MHLFRSDSLLTIEQARGDKGSAQCDVSFQALRGGFQLLSTVLGDDLLLDHVYGHLNDPWNEMADTIAKQEAQKSFFLPRPQLDMPKYFTKTSSSR